MELSLMKLCMRLSTYLCTSQIVNNPVSIQPFYKTTLCSPLAGDKVRNPPSPPLITISLINMMGKKEGLILTLMTSLLLLVLLGKGVWSLPIQKEENTLVDLLLAYEQQVPLSQINATLGAFNFKDLLVDPATASPPSSEAPSAVDSIEDAIFAALEAAQSVEISSTLGPPPPVVPQLNPFPFPPPSNPFPYPYPPPPNSISSQVASNVMKQFDLINSHPLNPHNLIGAAIVAPPPTGPPGEYIAGIFGSLAGVADNTIKLLASSSNTFFGVAGSVTCKLNPICAQG